MTEPSPTAKAIGMANDSSFGLAANVFSADLERADRVAGRLRAGKCFVVENARISNTLRHFQKQINLLKLSC